MQTEDLGFPQKITCCKTNCSVGKDIQLFTGEKERKLRPWMQPIFDNLEYLLYRKARGELDAILAE